MSHKPGSSFRALLWIALAGLAFAGSAAAQVGNGMSYFLWNARYAELEKAAEAEYAKRKEPGAWPIAPLCYARWKVKHYAKLFECADQLEARIKAGDRTMRHEDATLLYASDISAVPNLLRANAWLELGDNSRALGAAKQALAAMPNGSAFTFFSLARYQVDILPVAAIASHLLGDHAAADNYFDTLQKLNIGYPNTDVLRNLQDYQIARIYMIRGNYAKALEYALKEHGRFTLGLQSLFTSRESDDSLSTTFEIGKRFMVGKCLLETGKQAEAKKVFDELLANRRLADQGDIHWPVLYERGRIAEKEGDAKAAVDFFKRAVELIEQQRSSINTESSKIGFVGNKQSVYYDLIRMLVAQGQGSQAFEYVERSKARVLVDMLASKKDFAITDQNAAQVKALLAVTESAEADSRALDSAEKASQARGLLSDTRKQLVDQAPDLASLVSVTALTTSEIQQRIPADETLVEYYYGERELYAFVLTREGLHAQTLDMNGLVSDIQSFRKAIQNPLADAWRAPAQRLYARLVTPLESILGKGHLTIVAHGALHYLPFAALYDGKQFLIEHFAVRMLPAASVLKFLKAGGGAKPGELLAFGNPDLGDTRYNLPFAQSEAEGIAVGMPNSRVLVAKQATETAFKEYSTGFRFIHIASHGDFDSDAPLKSALLLARDGQNDGQLTVGELYSMRVDADLVTLSACETGLGKIASGDDVVGLTRGFLYAGASSIVASLWQVDDRATGQLMTSFYSALRSGVDKREALRRAQLAVLKDTPSPFFWAAFELTGSL